MIFCEEEDVIGTSTIFPCTSHHDRIFSEKHITICQGGLMNGNGIVTALLNHQSDDPFITIYDEISTKFS